MMTGECWKQYIERMIDEGFIPDKNGHYHYTKEENVYEEED